MTYNDLQWPTMTYYDLQWPTMTTNNDLQWPTMTYNDTLQCLSTMTYNEQQWPTMSYNIQHQYYTILSLHSACVEGWPVPWNTSSSLPLHRLVFPTASVCHHSNFWNKVTMTSNNDLQWPTMTSNNDLQWPTMTPNNGIAQFCSYMVPESRTDLSPGSLVAVSNCAGWCFNVVSVQESG